MNNNDQTPVAERDLRLKFDWLPDDATEGVMVLGFVNYIKPQ